MVKPSPKQQQTRTKEQKRETPQAGPPRSGTRRKKKVPESEKNILPQEPRTSGPLYAGMALNELVVRIFISIVKSLAGLRRQGSRRGGRPDPAPAGAAEIFVHFLQQP